MRTRSFLSVSLGILALGVTLMREEISDYLAVASGPRADNSTSGIR